MDSFFVEAQSAHPVCARKEGGSAPVAERVVRRTDGKRPKVGGAELKARRCVIEAREESKKRTRYNLKARGRIEKQRARNRKTRNRRIKAPEPKSERVRGSESESAQTRNQKACNLPTTL